MSTLMKCPVCAFDIPPSMERCPHCAQPGLFPNVRRITAADQAALTARYTVARNDAGTRNCAAQFDAFATDAASSKAVISRPLGDVERLATADNQGYSTYYNLQAAQVRFPTGEEWDRVRGLADKALFTNYEEHIRFAALSLNETGVLNYGQCSLVCREDMIGHRATTLWDNSAVLMKTLQYDGTKTTGMRASWRSRGELCAAKLGGRISRATQRADHAGLLLEQGKTSADDRFVEVHIWGPITIRTFEKVVVNGKRHSRAVLKALRQNLEKVGVLMEERP